MVRSRTPVVFECFSQKKRCTEYRWLEIRRIPAINDVGKVIAAPTQHAEYIGKDAQSIFPKAADQLKRQMRLVA